MATLPQSNPHNRQGGAVAVSTVLFILFVGLFFIALAVDIGRLYFENRSLQRIADAVALDVAHDSGLCGGGELNMDAAQAAAARNGFTGVFGAEGNQVLLGELEEPAGGVRIFNVLPPIDFDRADAVYVQVSRSVPRSIFLAGLFGDNLTLSKEAVARRLPIVSMSVGSGLLGIDTQQSEILDAVLGGLLNTSLSLGAVTYEGLATARVSIADLVAAHPGAGTVNELLLAELGVAEMLEVFVEAAAAGGESTVGLDGLLTGGVGLLPLSLGDILSVTSLSPEAGLEAQVGLFDLITATALFANRDNAVVVPLGTDLDLLGLANVGAELELYVIEPPQIAVGPPGRNAAGEWRTETSTAQVRTSLVASTGLDLLDLVHADVTLGIELDSASAEARAQSVICSTYAQQSFDPATFDVESGIASLALMTPEGEETIEVSVLPGLDLLGISLDSLISVSATLEIEEGNDQVELIGEQGELNFSGHRDDLPETERLSNTNVAGALGSGLTLLADNLNVSVDVGLLACNVPIVCGLVEGLLVPIVNELVNDLPLALVTQLLEPLLEALGDILTPILEALGISVGIADVTLMDMDMGPVELAL